MKLEVRVYRRRTRIVLGIELLAALSGDTAAPELSGNHYRIWITHRIVHAGGWSMCESETAFGIAAFKRGKNAFSQGISCCFGADVGTKMRKFFMKKAVTRTSVSCVTAFFFIRLVLVVRKQHG